MWYWIDVIENYHLEDYFSGIKSLYDVYKLEEGFNDKLFRDALVIAERTGTDEETFFVALITEIVDRLHHETDSFPFLLSS